MRPIWSATMQRRNGSRSEEHTSELQSHSDLVCRLLLEKKNLPALQGRGPDGKKARISVDTDLVSGAGREIHISPADQALALGLAAGFFLNDTPTTEIYTLSLHDALPISDRSGQTRTESISSSGQAADKTRQAESW